MGIAQVMQQTITDNVFASKILAVGTAAFLAHKGTMLNLRRGKIVGIADPLGGIGNVFTGTSLPLRRESELHSPCSNFYMFHRAHV